MQAAVEEKQDENIEELRVLVTEQTNKLTSEVAALRRTLEAMNGRKT
jgi:hypothetical protein